VFNCKQDKTKIYLAFALQQFWCSVHGSMNNWSEEFIIGCVTASLRNASVSLLKYVNKRLKRPSVSYIIM